MYFPQVEVIGDLNDTSHWDFSRLVAIREANEAQIIEGGDGNRFPAYLQRLVADIRRVLPSEGIVALENGIYNIWFARNYKAHMLNTLLLDNGLATMGAGLPLAMTAHLVHPNRPVISVYGDGCFMMKSQELDTAVRLNMHITAVILRDDGYAMTRWKQANMVFTDVGMDYGNPDFVKYAEAYGANFYPVESGDACNRSWITASPTLE